MTVSESVVKEFKARLETLSPIHVGSGERLSGLDYVVYDETVYVVDFDRLLNALMERRWLNRYLQFVSTSGGQKLLSNFLNGVWLRNGLSDVLGAGLIWGEFVDAIRDRSRRLLNRLLSRLAGTSQGGG